MQAYGHSDLSRRDQYHALYSPASNSTVFTNDFSIFRSLYACCVDLIKTFISSESTSNTVRQGHRRAPIGSAPTLFPGEQKPRQFHAVPSEQRQSSHYERGKVCVRWERCGASPPPELAGRPTESHELVPRTQVDDSTAPGCHQSHRVGMSVH